MKTDGLKPFTAKSDHGINTSKNRHMLTRTQG